jgi:LuxR family maltose regulon positive regulatory protein
MSTHQTAQATGQPKAPTGPTGDPLMLAKLDMPQLPPAALIRPRLLERITKGVLGRLTLVCAPPGAGKTTLLLSWVAAEVSPGPVVWLNLDALDRQPGIFWSYLLTGLARAGVPTSTVAAPAHPYRLDSSFLWNLSATLYQRSEPLVVVLDDADVLGDSPVGRQLDFLLRNSGPGLRLVVLTRGESPVPLSRYRLSGMVTEIRAADLAASQEEAEALFALRGVATSAEILDILMTRTRGWMAGLVLTGIGLRDQPQREQRPGGAGGGSEGLREYLDEEVLCGYTPSVRRFLVRMSIADHVPAGLADELTGQPEAARLLAELARHDDFVTCCDQHADCYRYHPVLQDVLRARLEEDSPGSAPQLHRRASAWFVAAGEPTEAAVHAAAAGEWRTAARLLVDGLAVAQLLAGPESSRLTWLLAGLPADTPGAETAVVRAAVALGRRDAVACAAQLAQARELAGQTPELASAVALGACAVASGLAAVTGDAKAALTACNAVEKLRREMPEAAAVTATHQLVLCNTARALLQVGRMDTALAVLAEAASMAVRCDPLRRGCDGLFSLAEALRGRLGRAVELAGPDPCPAAWPESAADRRSAAAEIALAWVASQTGDSAQARRRIAAVAGADLEDPMFASLLAVVRARVHRAEGDPASALAVLEAAVGVLEAARGPTDGDRVPSWLDGRLAAEAAATWTGTGRPDLATQLLAGFGPAAGSEVALELARARLADGEGDLVRGSVTDLLRHVDLPLDVRIDALLLRAAEALERGDTAAAKAAAERALRTAAPERLRRPILEAPARLRGFLRHHDELAARHTWFDEAEPTRSLPAQAPAIEPQAVRSVLIEPLTEKEHEVLVHLAELLATDEIARRMYVSVNTVRTHVRAILRKLAASRRNEAIRRARELHII